jgi:hypothetical protein
MIDGASAPVLFLFGGSGAVAPGPPAPYDPDEIGLLKNFGKMDVWHVSLDATVHDNDQDPVATREAVFVPPPTGRLCLIRFDVPRAEGEYGYGLKLQGPPRGGHAIRRSGA